jgi:hypothetical protein
LYPDIVTFGVLALGCRTKQEAQFLLADMRDAGFRYSIDKTQEIQSIVWSLFTKLKHACEEICTALLLTTLFGLFVA